MGGLGDALSQSRRESVQSKQNADLQSCMEELKLTAEQVQWVDEVWTKLDDKLSVVAVRSRNKLPFQTWDPMHNNMAESNIHRWANGFWPGLMWLMYAGTQNETYRETAETGERMLDAAFEEPEKLTHDVGFMWKLATGPDYLLTGNRKSWQCKAYCDS